MHAAMYYFILFHFYRGDNFQSKVSSSLHGFSNYFQMKSFGKEKLFLRALHLAGL